MFAYLTEKFDMLMSVLDHLSYKNCSIQGKNGKIQVTYPTFNFEVSGTNRFEFNIAPGKNSKKDVLWQPFKNQQITDIKHDNNQIQIKKLNFDTTLPPRATEHSTGYDIAAAVSVTIPANDTALVPLSFAMSFSNKLKCDLRPRSSLSLKGINVALGTIDPDYRGEVKAIITNIKSTPVTIHIGQRIGQLGFSSVTHPDIKVAKSLLDATNRGNGGFGSTGEYDIGHMKCMASTTKRFTPTLPTIHQPIVQHQ